MLLEFFSRAYLSRIFQQQRQDSGSLRLQLDLKSVPPQLTGLKTELEDSETNDTWGQSWIFHGARFRSLCIQLFGTRDGLATRSEERRVGKSVDLGGRRIIKKKKRKEQEEPELRKTWTRCNYHVI